MVNQERLEAVEASYAKDSRCHNDGGIDCKDVVGLHPGFDHTLSPPWERAGVRGAARDIPWGREPGRRSDERSVIRPICRTDEGCGAG